VATRAVCFQRRGMSSSRTENFPTLLGAAQVGKAVSDGSTINSEGDRRKQAPPATIGRGPGHQSLQGQPSSSVASPGPATYQSHWTSIGSSGPKATFGSRSGHEVSTSSTPGPGEFSTSQVTHIKGGNYFGTPHSSLEDGPQQRRLFRLIDSNHDSSLDFAEVCAFLRSGDCSITEAEVKRLFQAMDVNQDGRIVLDEFREFLKEEGVARGHKAWKKKLRAACERSGPGPADYSVDDRAKSKTRRTPAALMGRPPLHDDLGGFPSPGPATYRAEDAAAALAWAQPSATMGRGPGHGACLAEASPGPGDYKPEQAWRPRTSGVLIGAGPGHIPPVSSNTASPGPATYRCDYSLLGNRMRAPVATIGSGPGHQAVKADDVPGPAAYNTARRQASGACRFGTEERFCLPRLRVL